MTYPSSYWAATAPQHNLPGTATGTIRCDVAIVGAGLTGLSTAYHLRKHQVKVTVLEGQTVGWGASGRTGAQVNTGFRPSFRTIQRRWGLEAAQDALNMSIEAVQLVGQLVATESLDCNFTQSGFIRAAITERDLETLADEQRFMADEGYATRMLDASDLQQELQSPLYVGGLLETLPSQIHPLKFVRELARVCQQAGVEIWEHSPVIEKISGATGSQNVVLRTPFATIHAEAVVLATNGYTTPIQSREITRITRSVLPVGSFIIVTDPVPEVVSLIPHNRSIADTGTLTTHFRRLPDNSLLIGGRIGPNDSDDKMMHSLAGIIHEIFPSLAQVGVRYQWGGYVGVTRDFLPRLGHRNQLYYAMGCNGHGVALGTYFGKYLAQKLTHSDIRSNWLEKLGLPVMPGKHLGTKAINFYSKLQRNPFQR